MTQLKPISFTWCPDMTVVYTNYRGEAAQRVIRPISLRYGVSQYHTEPQWIMRALDLDRNVEREFALLDMKRTG